MKYKAPHGVNGADVGGGFFPVDKDGNITVPDEGNYHELLRPHGFVPLPPDTTSSAPPPAFGE